MTVAAVQVGVAHGVGIEAGNDLRATTEFVVVGGPNGALTTAAATRITAGLARLNTTAATEDASLVLQAQCAITTLIGGGTFLTGPQTVNGWVCGIEQAAFDATKIPGLLTGGTVGDAHVAALCGIAAQVAPHAAVVDGPWTIRWILLVVTRPRIGNRASRRALIIVAALHAIDGVDARLGAAVIVTTTKLADEAATAEEVTTVAGTRRVHATGLRAALADVGAVLTYHRAILGIVGADIEQ